MNGLQLSLGPEFGHLDNRPLYMLEQRAVSLIQFHEPPEGYHGRFSGGKDSIVIKDLARRAGVKVRWTYSLTTIDPPELVRFIRKHHPDVEIIRSKWGNFFARMVKKGVFPTRQMRWCCSEYKENVGTQGETIILGVRIAESSKRSKRYSACFMRHETKQRELLLPIRLWPDSAVWEYIKKHNLPYCGLYDEGFSRLGCIGCPITTKQNRKLEFDRWPRYRALWETAFTRIWNNRAGKIGKNGKEWFCSMKFKSADELFEWWVNQ